MIKIIPITKHDFYHSQMPIAFHDEECARHYYHLSYKNRVILKLSVQSEIQPVAIIVNDIIAIGCDQLVAFFSIKNNELMRTLLSSSFFYNFEVTDAYIFIVCEIEVIVLSLNNLHERYHFEFIDYIDHVKLNGNKLSIYFMNGSSEDVSI
ncbi:Uncharacterised protein [Buttiauxella agrestis]|uniref:Uncharacterized protein n=1 Tax=Buttiauxella agrestis TaxID=82977 RepID=A0A381CF54_9ENTR|nr:hypothetical protein [Buttiauxella agrestis]SUW65723.1 Uncharacterised protein [Buttiauxella agrestis]